MSTDPIDVKAAEVMLPDGRFVRRGRVFVSNERTVVWAETADRRGVEVVFEQRTYAVVESTLRDAGVSARQQRVRVATDAGEILVRPTGGCGCGPLARIKPG